MDTPQLLATLVALAIAGFTFARLMKKYQNSDCPS